MEPRKEQITEDARSRPMVVADPWKAVTAYWSSRITSCCTKIQMFVVIPCKLSIMLQAVENGIMDVAWYSYTIKLAIHDR